MGRSWPQVREARRLRLAELLLAQPGLSAPAAARLLGCSASTALRDMHAIRAEWAARRAALYEEAAAEDLRRTDAALQALWPAVLAGKGWAIERLVSLLTYRARVLGLEQPRATLDLGEALARYLARCAGAEPADAPPA